MSTSQYTLYPLYNENSWIAELLKAADARKNNIDFWLAMLNVTQTQRSSSIEFNGVVAYIALRYNDEPLINRTLGQIEQVFLDGNDGDQALSLFIYYVISKQVGSTDGRLRYLFKNIVSSLTLNGVDNKMIQIFLVLNEKDKNIQKFISDSYPTPQNLNMAEEVSAEHKIIHNIQKKKYSKAI